jgi:phytoene/squalene synthetase
LQLANFWQDVAEDWDRGRVYLPLGDCRRFGYDETMFAGRVCNDQFRRLLAAEVDQAEGYLRRGLPLVPLMPPELQLDVALFVHGGLAILKAIRRQDYDIWTTKPQVSKKEKLRLLASCWWRLQRGTLLTGES